MKNILQERKWEVMTFPAPGLLTEEIGKIRLSNTRVPDVVFLGGTFYGVQAIGYLQDMVRVGIRRYVPFSGRSDQDDLLRSVGSEMKLEVFNELGNEPRANIKKLIAALPSLEQSLFLSIEGSRKSKE